MILPTAADRAVRLADFATLTEALDFAATGETGLTLHAMRGDVAEALSYGRLREDALALAPRLLAAGLEPGERVGLVAETDGDFLRAFFACQYAGLIPAPLPLPAPLGGREAYVAQVTRMLEAADAAAVVGPAAITAWMADAPPAAVRFVGALTDLPPAAGAPLPDIRPDDPCYLQFSSGSTRFPTGVLVTHRALMANAQAIVRHGLQVRPADRASSWLPLYHDMGLVGFVLTPLACQMSVDLLPTGAFVRRPLLWLELISRNGATISYSPTFGYELCTRRADRAGPEALDLSRWRIAGLGGDMIRSGPLRDFARQFGPAGFSADAYVTSYGMAEATLALSMAPLGRGLAVETLDIGRLERESLAVTGAASDRTRDFARCGPALPGHELQVRGDDGRPLAERAVGRIFARGPSLMRGYFRQPEETGRVLSADGWLDTGDLGFLDGGEIVLTGRSKDLMIVNGRNIWPQDLEWTCEDELPAVRNGDVAAFSVPGADEEQVVVLVQARGPDLAVRDALRAEVGRVLRQRHSVEAEVRLVGPHALPQTSSGKLSRAKARQAYLAGAFDLERTRA
ncbi:fatty acyl-AMP ligase [Phenylobacterium sp.]|uniref:fatty acyl-AMP ligase n=1 Tax=Phenylobacterium sp. TaxID=1871053 RepID=UPI0039833D4E